MPYSQKPAIRVSVQHFVTSCLFNGDLLAPLPTQAGGLPLFGYPQQLGHNIGPINPINNSEAVALKRESNITWKSIKFS
jgi:hypothetical protein